MCFGLPDANVRRRNGIAKLEAALDKSGITDYWLALDIDSYGPLPVPPGRLVRAFRRWLDEQDLSALESLPLWLLPAFRWDRDGWQNPNHTDRSRARCKRPRRPPAIRGHVPGG